MKFMKGVINIMNLNEKNTGENKKLEWGNPENPNFFERKGYTKEDLIKGVRNPFYHELNKDVTIGVRNEDYELYEKIAHEKGVRIEMVIKRAVASYAKMIREDKD